MGGMVTFPEQKVEPGPYQGYLNDRCVTIPEVLRGAGYRGYMSGKWHVGESPEIWPRKRGFDRYFGLISGGSSYWELSKDRPRPRVMAIDDDPYFPEGDRFYMTDAFTDYAVRFIEEHPGKDTPFFLYLAYTAPHWPMHAWPEDVARYQEVYHAGWDALRRRRHERMIELGMIDPKWSLSPRDPDVLSWEEATDKEDRALRMAVYAAMIDRMDQGIGRVLGAIQKAGIEENTFVLFLSDNGGCHENLENHPLNKPGALPGTRESFVSYQRPWATVSNVPFRMFKHWVHEGGIASPCIARWPARIRSHGTITAQVGHVIDLMATCCEIAGAGYPNEVGGRPVLPNEGKSLVPILDGRTRTPHEALYWEHMGNRAVRHGNWKLVAKTDQPWELYDLAADRTELRDRIRHERKVAATLRSSWEAWARRCGARV
jgi:arylsulfatase